MLKTDLGGRTVEIEDCPCFIPGPGDAKVVLP